MGERGPVPTRSDQRRRNNKPEIDVDTPKGAENVEIPEAGPWTAPALRWYESLAESGQSVFYEPSDWAQAWIWAELLDRELQRGKPSAMMIAQWAAGASELLTTEGARRRTRIELAKANAGDPDKDNAVDDLAAFRKRLTG